MSGGTLNTAQFYVGSYEDTSFNGAQQVNLSGTARVFASNFAEIGSSQGADSYLNMSGSATLETTYQLNVGMFGNATVVMSGNSTIKTDNNWVDIAPNTGACNFTMTGNSQFLTPAGLTFDIGTGNNTTAAFTGALGVFNVQQNALLEPGQLFVGRWNYGAGAVYQSGGSVISSGGNGNWVIGGTDGNTNPYGYYNLSAGTFNSGSSALCISDTGVGVWDQTGGNATVYQNVYVANQSTGMGVMNVNGGTFTTAATTSWGQGIFVGNAGSGVLNIGATGVVNTGAGDLWLTNSNGASSPAVGIANIGTTAQPGGHLVAEGIWSGGGQTAILNFHGGTVTATQNEGSFIGNLSHIFVYPEGATIDPAGNSIGLIQAFEAPTGVGIQSIAVASGGIGYIGTPVVTISGGSGQGATAVAVVSNGVITGFSITNPGSGYLPTDSLSVSVSGIGALAAGAAGAVTFNSGNNSGGLTLINSGTVAFCAPNTYTGNTVLQGPQVQLNSQVWNGSANVPAPAFAGNVVMNGSTYLVAEQPGQFGVNSALSFLQYGEFVLNGNSQTVAGLSDSSGKGIVENANSNLGAPAGNASTLTVYAGAGSSYYFNGLLRDNDNGTGGVLSLTKDGPGVLTLGGNSYGGNNTYSGVTTILNGTLALDATGTFPNSSLITIASGAVLDLTAKASSFNFGAGQTVGGYGTINIGSGKTVTFTGGGTLAPGGSIGTLNVVGNVDLTGGVAALELGTPGTSFASTGISDMTAITGNLTLGGTLNAIDNAGHNGQGSAGGGFYEIFTYTGSESGSFVASTGLIGTTLHGGAVNVPANKAVYLVVTNYGLPNTLTTPVNLGDIHPDGSFTPQNVGVTNVTAPGAFSESLEATSGSWDQILAPGASANLTVGISDTTPGPKNISVPVSFTSKAIPGTGMPDTVGAGSGVPGLQTQTVYVTGNVYGYAAPSVPASVPLGNIHPDGAFAPGSITVSNAAPTTGYYENLGCDAVSGPIVPGGSAGVTVGISDTSVGPKDVPVTLNFTSLPIVSDLSPTSLGSQTVHVTGTVYGYAAPSVAASVPLGDIHPDGAFAPGSITVSNAVPSSPYYECLACDAVSGGPIAPGGSAGVTVGISDTSVGPKDVPVTLNFTSKAYAGTGLSDTPLGSQTVHVTGTVYGYAAPSVPASVPLGDIHPDGAFAPGSITVSNAAPTTGYYENLGCDAVSGGPIAPGGSAGVPVGISDTSVGPKDVPVTLNFTSLPIVSDLSPTSLGSQTVHVTGTVYGYAAPSVPASVPLGNIHPDGAFAPGSITVSNAAPTTGYYENLGCDAVSGPIVPGGSAGVPVGISDTSVGPKDVPVTLNFTSLPIVSDLSPTSLGSQTVHVTGTVYGYAAPSVVPTSVDLGNIHPDGAFGSSGVTVSNAVPNSPYYEYLACDGLPDPIAPGGSGVVPVGISDTGVGPHAADVTLNFTSKAYAGTGLSDTPLAPQTVHVTGTVYGYAVPSVPASVDLGNIHPDGAFAPGSITVSNAAPSTGYYENLGCDAVSGPIVPGASAGVTVGISDTSVGPKDVPVTLNFTSLPIASGLSASPLASQTVHVTGTVYGYAVPSSLSTPVDLGNIHVGDSFVPQNVTVANQAPASDYSEPLYANSGAWSTTIPGGSSDSSLLVGISDTTAGPHDVPVTVSFTSKAVASGLSDTDLGSQTLHVIGTVWNYAAPATIASPGSVGKVFRDTAVSRSLSVSNVAPTLYSEGLDASFGAPTGPIYGVGSVSNLGGGLSDSSMTVSLDTSSAGHKDASVLVNLVSNGSNSGLGNTDLGSQTVAMSGDVYDHGVASFDGATKVDALHLVLSGNVHDTVTQSYNLYNLMQTEGYTGALDVVGWDVTGGTAVDPGLSPATIAAGSSQSLTATLDTSVAGTFPLETVTIHLTDSAADGIAGDTEAQTLVLTIDAQVVPEPSTIILLAVALLGVVAYWRRSR